MPAAPPRIYSATVCTIIVRVCVVQKINDKWIWNPKLLKVAKNKVDKHKEGRGRNTVPKSLISGECAEDGEEPVHAEGPP